MDEMKWLEGAAGKLPPVPPRIDVTERVMRTLKQRESAQPAVGMTGMLLGVAMAGWAVAAVAIVFAVQAVAMWQNPLVDLLRF